MNKEVCIGKLYYKKIAFQLFFHKETKKVVARLVGEHPEKEKMEQVVTQLIQNFDGGSSSKLSIKKLAIFAGILACLGKPTMLVHASERVSVETMENQEFDTLDFNSEYIDKEIILYGKSEVDDLFLNDSISKDGVLSILNRTSGMSDEVRGYVKEFIETVYEKEPNADMRIFAMNLMRDPQIYINLDAHISRCEPKGNRIWFHKVKKDLIFHELSHFRTLTYGESYVKNDPKARIKVVGNSFVNSYAGSGMREAYCVALNHRIGSEDEDYSILFTMEKMLYSMFPEKMHEIETYNDYEGLKAVFLQNGLTADDYNQFIATTDTISKVYQNSDLELDYSLIQNMMKPVVTLALNKCVVERLDYLEYVGKIEASIPNSEWKDYLMMSFRNTLFLNISPTVDQSGNRIISEEVEVGPAFDETLKEDIPENIGPAYDETLTAETPLLLGEENIGPDFDYTLQQESVTNSETHVEEQSVEENSQSVEQTNLELSHDLSAGPAFDESLQQKVNIETENFGPAYDLNLQTQVNDVEIGPGISNDSAFFDNSTNYDYQSSNSINYEDFNQISSEYYEESNLRR